jgi:hypothetical protein
MWPFVLAVISACSLCVQVREADPLASLEGHWIATTEGSGITAAWFVRRGDALDAIVWGSCQPSDCPWPRRPVIAVKSFDQVDDSILGVIHWDDPKRTQYVFLRLHHDVLTIETFWMNPPPHDGRETVIKHTDKLVRRDSPSPPVVSTASPRSDGGSPTVADQVRAAYRTEFGEVFGHSAIYDDPTNGRCTGPRQITTTAYLKSPSNRTSELLTIHLSPEGALISRTHQVVPTPSGTIRVLAVLVRHATTLGDNSLADWTEAQNEVNRDHERFARSRGYQAPIVRFHNTNLLVDAKELSRPGEFDVVKSVAARYGQVPGDFDVVMTMNIDPAKQEGGLTIRANRSVYVGNFGGWTRKLEPSEWRAIATAAYHHEIAHLWGWEHDWANECLSQRLFEPFVTAPVLFGWEDTNGDGIPEILSNAPYR